MLVALGLLEVGLRVYFDFGRPWRMFDTRSPVQHMRWIPHPFVPYAGRPNATFELKNDDGSTEHITTNSYGFRAHEFPTAKRPEDYFVFCFGGSTTYGFKTPTNALTWPERLEHRLQARYPERRVRVFNLGVDMASSNFSIVNLALVAAHVQPDLVIAYHGFNDLSVLNGRDYRWDHSHSYHDLIVSRGIQSRSPEWLLQSHVWFVLSGIVDLWSRTNDLYLAARHDLPARPDEPMALADLLVNYDTLYAIARGAQAEVVFSTFQFRDASPPEQAHNQALRRRFEERGWPYVDQDALLPDHDPSINVDPCHFTQKGNEMMAQHFFEHIEARRLLESRTEP